MSPPLSFEPSLLAVRPGTLNAKDKAALRRAGVVVIECEDPTELRLMRPWSEINGSDLLVAAMRGCMANTMTNHSAMAFMKAISDLIEQRVQKALP